MFTCVKANRSIYSTVIKQLLPIFYSQSNIIITLTCGVNKIRCKNNSTRCIARYPGQPDMHSSNEGKVLIQGMFISGILYILHFYPFYTFTEFYLVKLAPQLIYHCLLIYRLYQKYISINCIGNITSICPLVIY